MPWKDSQFWSTLLSMPVFAPLLAFFTAMMRIMYDEQEPRFVRTMLESGVCGLLAVASTAAIQAIGLHDKWAVFAGGVIGFMGADYIRFLARDVIRQRTATGHYRYQGYWRNRYQRDSNDDQGGH